MTAIAVGHSSTLIVATVAGWQVDPSAVDVVIVLSVAFVGAVAMIGRPRRWRLFGGTVFAFGLVHGELQLGLATRLQQVGLPEQGLMWKVLAFNVGVEIGQVTAIMGMIAIARVATMGFRLDQGGRGAGVAKALGAGLFLLARTAAPVAAYEAFTDVKATPTDLTLPEGRACRLTERSKTFAGAGQHPSQEFYSPQAPAAIGDLGHALGDGYVIVLCDPSLTSPAVEEVRAFVADEPDTTIAAPSEETAPQTVQAFTLTETLTCQLPEWHNLSRFRIAWLESRR